MAATYSPTLPAFYLSVKKKKILRSKDKAVRFTELLIGGKKKSLTKTFGHRKYHNYRNQSMWIMNRPQTPEEISRPARH